MGVGMKRKRPLTEEDVYKANSGLIRAVCNNYGKKIEHEDREAIANEGMIYAIRSYKRGVSAFELHAVSCMKELLWNAEDEQRRVCRVEHHLSLDMQLKQGESTTRYVEMIANLNSDHISLIIVSDFINQLERKLRCIALLFMNGYTTKEIAERMHISVDKIEQLRNDIFFKWKEYDQ